MDRSIRSEIFGIHPSVGPVEKWTLVGGGGLRLEVIPYGAAITRLSVPDRLGRVADVVLGLNDLDSYLGNRACFGAIAGRVAGRVVVGPVVETGGAAPVATAVTKTPIDAIAQAGRRVRVMPGVSVRGITAGSEGRPNTSATGAPLPAAPVVSVVWLSPVTHRIYRRSRATVLCATPNSSQRPADR